MDSLLLRHHPQAVPWPRPSLRFPPSERGSIRCHQVRESLWIGNTDRLQGVGSEVLEQVPAKHSHGQARWKAHVGPRDTGPAGRDGCLRKALILSGLLKRAGQNRIQGGSQRSD